MIFLVVNLLSAIALPADPANYGYTLALFLIVFFWFRWMLSVYRYAYVSSTRLGIEGRNLGPFLSAASVVPAGLGLYMIAAHLLRDLASIQLPHSTTWAYRNDWGADLFFLTLLPVQWLTALELIRYRDGAKNFAWGNVFLTWLAIFMIFQSAWVVDELIKKTDRKLAEVHA